MVMVSLSKAERDFLLQGVRTGVRGLDDETYPEFRKTLRRLEYKLMMSKK